MEVKQGFCQAIVDNLKPYQNPHPYEKWKRGRPNKESIEKRRVWREWNQKQLASNKGMLSFMIEYKNPDLIKGEGKTLIFKAKSRK